MARSPLAPAALLAASFLTAAPAGAQTVGSLELVGQAVVPFSQPFDGGPVVGISGLTHLAGDTYLGISDVTDAAPFYVLTIDIGEDGTAPTLAWRERRQFRNPHTADGTWADGSLDPEAIAYDPEADVVYWVSESRGGTNTPVFMLKAKTDGTPIGEVAINDKYDHTRGQTAAGALTQGIFGSAGFESLTFAPDGSALFAAPEDTLVQDGPSSKSGDGATGHARIIRYVPHGDTFAAAAEYVYEVSPREDTTSGDGANSLVDLLAIDDTTLLALEREWPDTPGTTPPSRNIKIFEIGLADATDVRDVASLAEAEFTPVTKRLVLDLDTLVAADNGVDGVLSYEALIFGPDLADGRRSLIMLNDNDGERDNQLLVFAVNPAD
ncbi:esterase-like activity of phytase family protein [Acuticoccus sp. I52.16.1]|uniref:esterase-like activity of phytase family protein n=1 Tax=Acuticoccus sp. I52.16.1 TaxID=2928472 RepID=UPI001FD4BDFA|nr:esterase-like activity of phytase family protein [Acuticoccus sp. I52.16.1]UOM36366.1 esterase-like activity of phytase family protein [Acuticoccus sp. I52.16.1]